MKVLIYGKEYLIHGRGDLDFIRHVARYVDERMAEIDEEIPTNSVADLAILTALNIAHELFLYKRDQSGSDNNQEETKRIIRQLTERIQNQLETDLP